MTLLPKTPSNLQRMDDAPKNDSWSHWFQHYGPKLLLCARSWTRSYADAEDVVQEAFVRFWKHQRNLPGEPMALLVTSVRRAALDLGRREGRRVTREERAADGADLPVVYFESSLEDDERRAAIEGALQRIPPEQREVLVLKIWAELTFEQIAAELGLSPNTAASRYRYALAALRRELTAADCHG
jgi:RNA polymerase sigma-70 factor (ECF subfamily)